MEYKLPLSIEKRVVENSTYKLSRSWEQDNCHPDNCYPGNCPQIISSWTIGPQTIAPQNN